MAGVPNLDLDDPSNRDTEAAAAARELAAERARAADGTEQFAKAVERMVAADLRAAEAAAKAQAAAAQRAAEVKRLKELYGDYADQIDKTTQRNKQLAAALGDGTFARQARDAANLTREYRALSRQAELVTRYGERVGSMAARLGFTSAGIDRLGQAISSGASATATVGLVTAGGLAARGMSGTVESARLDYAMEQLSRQFAAVMKPMTDSMTYLAGQIERRMAGMNGTEQNRLMGGIVGGGLGLRYGGLPGAVLGFGAGAGLAGGGNSTTMMMGAAGGAALGFRYGGPVGAAVGGVAGGMAGTSRSYAEETGPEYYRRMRRPASEGGGGASVAGAYLQAILEAGRRTFLDGPLPGKAPGRPEPRRDVTPFQADMGDAGSTYFRMQAAMIRTTAGADFEDGGPLKPVIDVLLRMLDVMLMGAGMPPRAATDAR